MEPESSFIIKQQKGALSVNLRDVKPSPAARVGVDSLPVTGVQKLQRGQRTVLDSPGSGRTLPQSGQKFGSRSDEDIWEAEQRLCLFRTRDNNLTKLTSG